MWTDVPSQPPVVNPLDNGDVHFSVSYVFGGSQQQLAQTSDEPQKSSVVMLDPGTTYVARLRSENLHGWSDWSTDVIFVGTYIHIKSNINGLHFNGITLSPITFVVHFGSPVVVQNYFTRIPKY